VPEEAMLAQPLGTVLFALKMPDIFIALTAARSGRD
jgi:hypothetical protein